MRLLIFQGEKTKQEDFKLEQLVESLRMRLEYMHQLSIDDLLEFFDKLCVYWQESGLAKEHNLTNLSQFLAKDNLANSLQIALHNNYQALDKFVDLKDKNLLFHAQPRGLTVHWLAGNVAVLGLFSIFLCLITKNVCLVKAANQGYQELVDLLQTLSQVKTEKINGKDLTQSITVVLIENQDKEMHQALSQVADVRIAWGGQEAIKAITSLEKNSFSEDIIFGPKYSYALIDKESLQENLKELAQRMAIDVSVFDQYACSSPHTVFVQEETKGQAMEFAEELAKQMEFVSRTLLPKEETGPKKAAEIVSLRAEQELKGRVFSSTGTTWTVVYSEEPGLAKGCFSRVIFVKPINALGQLAELNDRQKQTMGVALTEENKEKYLDLITRNGIDRCPDLGLMTFYESPWDGMFVFDRLVRWVTRYK